LLKAVQFYTDSLGPDLDVGYAMGRKKMLQFNWQFAQRAFANGVEPQLKQGCPAMPNAIDRAIANLAINPLVIFSQFGKMEILIARVLFTYRNAPVKVHLGARLFKTLIDPKSGS
jgi:hypothetical protein